MRLICDNIINKNHRDLHILNESAKRERGAVLFCQKCVGFAGKSNGRTTESKGRVCESICVSLCVCECALMFDKGT